jgi:spore coat protein U-like protein
MNTILRTILLTACAVIVSGIGNVTFAATATSNMAVSANVSGDCTIAANPLGFGSYDPVTTNSSSGSDAITTTNLLVTCTADSTATITLGQGINPASGSSDDAPLRRMANGSGAFINYSLYQDEGLSTTWGNSPATGEPYEGTGSTTSVTVFGDATKGQSVPAGAYNDTVVATITF